MIQDDWENGSRFLFWWDWQFRFCGAYGALQRQQALAQEVIRLHVIAASDSDADQALKLQVRDAVLAQATDWLAGTTDRDEAENILRTHLAELRDTAQATVQSQGCGDAVEAWLTRKPIPRGITAPLLCRAGISEPAHHHRRGRGAQLVVRGISAAVHHGGYWRYGRSGPGRRAFGRGCGADHSF